MPVPEPVQVLPPVPERPEPDPAPVAEEAGERSPAPRRARGRRRSAGRPRARSAFFSVAAPSLAVLGVTAVATAATVNGSGGSGNDQAPVAAPDPSGAEPVAANREFDTQLNGLSAAVDDYANRASRTQGRIEMAEQREAEERAAEREAARREAMRPKFWLPVEQHGLSAYFGDAGINWMSLHTGIDFPVSYGTPVMAATDGYITTQWDYSYGNMVVLTAPDGTETWYAHLDSTVYTSGYVEAGTLIAYSGDSGNSTGPHLHFEVRPGGGDPIDPLPWLREHGLEPT
jgi:murein DD-endopeptidase MepM/ murein hydrolase activator NlpD